MAGLIGSAKVKGRRVVLERLGGPCPSRCGPLAKCQCGSHSVPDHLVHTMLDISPLLLARSLQERARKIMAQVETVGEADACHMRETAARYEKLAKRFEQQFRDAKKA